jgi:hypothetical protein
MNNVFWVGLYPGITQKMLSYMADVLRQLRKSAAQGA